jgi:iron-sulfur cluster assembly protein
MITVTETASNRIRRNLTQRGSGMGIRLGVRTTGCSGLAYVLEYVDALATEDTAFEQDGFVVVVDPKSLTLMDGLEVDYVRQGLNEGFEFRNPNEKDRCGCGESFRI